jgi:hypothetical protein
LETVKVNENIYSINYYSINMKLLYSLEVNNFEQALITKYEYHNPNVRCGQAVADCLGDAYSNHGWISVWAVVQTAFLPVTAAGLAAACAAKVC